MFHKQMDAYLAKGIQVNYLAWPRGGIQNDEAFNTMMGVWCAKDRKAAMSQAKKTGTYSGAKDLNCDAAKQQVVDHFQLGQMLGVQGTPAIFDMNGRQLGGYLSPDDLARTLETR
jgi:thiol:disulfide interchange protein DsbC